MAASSSIERRVVAIGDGDIACLTGGAGEAVVFLHGVGSAARSWSAQLEHFVTDHFVAAWNAPGYAGSSHLADDAPDAGAYAQALARWLDALGIERAHIVGHSLGCLIAGRFAVENSARVASLTLASTALGHARLPAEERERLLRSRLGDVEQFGAEGMAARRAPRLLGDLATPAHVEAVRETMAAIDPVGYAQAARMLGGGDLLGDIARLPASMRMQVVYGTRDVITPPEANERAAHARTNIAVATISGAGHALYIEAPAEFNRILADFIGRR